MSFDPNAVGSFAVVDGARMHYRKLGSGPPLLLIHGMVSSSAAWHMNLQALAAESTVYAVDLMGLGFSDRVPGQAASISAVAQRMFTFMDAVGLDCADVIAHSQGGAIALKMAGMHPERIAALVLVSPANPDSHGSDFLISFYRSRIGSMVARLSPRFPRWMRTFALKRMFGNTDRMPPNSLECHTVGLRTPGTVEHVLRTLETWHDDMEALRADIRSIAERRVLLIWGDRDLAVSVESAELLHSALHKSELSIYEGVGHIPYEESPERFNAEVSGWLRRSRTS